MLELADWVLRMDDGEQTILGLLDDKPTGLASATTDPGYHGPGRGAGNSLNVLLDAWLLASDQRYLAKAEEIIHRCIHLANAIDSLDLLNAEKRWSYTVFLSALARYLDLKAERGDFDRSYAYAQRSLLHYADWMVAHERPYLDRPDELEYPTETWAAQELRKANVLQLASRHAEPSRADAMREFARAVSARARAICSGIRRGRRRGR